jgi:hypothetical protein
MVLVPMADNVHEHAWLSELFEQMEELIQIGFLSIPGVDDNDFLLTDDVNIGVARRFQRPAVNL